MDRDRFETWLALAQPGETLVYHGPRDARNFVTDSLFKVARDAARAGLVVRFQRQVPDGFEYLAVRISPKTARRLGKPWEHMSGAA